MKGSTMIYVTPDELAAYIDPDAEIPAAIPLAIVLIRSASQLVLDAIAGATYRVDVDGLPTDAVKLLAVKSATCEQASAWAANGIDPRKGAAQVKAVIASKSAEGVAVSYVAMTGAQQAAQDLAAADTLTGPAWRILDNAGLISNRANTLGQYVLQ